MGAVYEARNVSTLKRCAVKVLLTPELAADDEVVRRFFREARASGVVESEHVVAAYDSGLDDAGHAYYVMDALQGEDLQQTLRRVGSLSPVTAAKIILQAANGLASVHSLGIVHRDIKPANLFLTVCADHEIKVKILDFGIAKVKMEVFHESSHELTRTGSMLGTPLYMSPEQVKRASSIDESADVWSLGVVLFESVSGKLPWGNVESFGELIAAVLTQDLPLLQDYAAWVPPDLANIVHRTLSRDALSRTKKASELSAALRRFLDGDVRLFEHELVTVSQYELSQVADRLSLADTMLMPAGRQPGAPVVRSVSPRANSPGRFALAVAGLGAVLASSAWFVARRAATPLLPSVIAAVSSPPGAAAEMMPPLISAPETEVSFPLEVSPSGVKVSVDGVSIRVRDGRVQVIGRAGSEHIVELVWGKQRFSQTVVIGEHGVVPPKLSSPAADTVKPSPKPVSPQPTASGNRRVEEPDIVSDGGLDPVFK